ncbi:MAG: NADH-quinone oxidoreductase subunit N [Planctomycetaceae bacterium]
MNRIDSIVTTLIDATKDDVTRYFVPELCLCVTIVMLLLVRLFNGDRKLPAYSVALGGAVVAFIFAWLEFLLMRSASLETSSPLVLSFVDLFGLDLHAFQGSHSFFTGLLVFDQFTVFFRLFLLLFLILVIALTVLSGIPDMEDGPDFYTLLLGAVIGMMLMASANHLLILFLGIEMASVPSYVMAGFLKGRKDSSEASLKFVVYGAGSAGVMLYGISMLSGLVGSGDFGTIAVTLGQKWNTVANVGLNQAGVSMLVLALVMILVGFAFKLSVVPFHFWCPDVFEGASAEVGGFLSVASKAAAFALLVRLILAITGQDPGSLQDMYLHLGIGIGVVAAVTSTFGNLAAYPQTNVKRLLAYSTIAHAGYMLMAVSALLVVKSAPPELILDPTAHAEQAQRCVEGLLYYLVVYLFMNLGAFAIVALIRNQIFSEEISDYRGLIKQTPTLCICMLICMFSLIGMPPFGGFVGKLMIFASLYDAGSIHWSMWAILVIAGLNTVFSLFYYLKVLRAMFIASRPADLRSAEIPLNSSPGLYVLMLTIPVVLLGIFVQDLSATARGVAQLLIP